MNQIWRSKVTDHRSFCFWHITHGAIFLMRLKSVIYFLSHHFFLTSLTSSHSSTFTHSSLSCYFSLKFYLSSSTRPQSDLSHYAFSISPSFLHHISLSFIFSGKCAAWGHDRKQEAAMSSWCFACLLSGSRKGSAEGEQDYKRGKNIGKDRWLEMKAFFRYKQRSHSGRWKHSLLCHVCGYLSKAFEIC